MRISKIIKDIDSYLEDLAEILPNDEEELKRNKEKRYSTAFLVECVISGCIDLGFEIVSILGLAYPATYKQLFELLEKKKIITKTVADKLKELVGLRNIIAHHYTKIDTELLFEKAKYMIESGIIEKFLAQIIKKLKDKNIGI